MARYVVAGATGRVGSSVASELLNAGARVTVVVRSETGGRDWEGRGADVAAGSLDDRAFVARVTAGAAGLFTLLPETVAADEFHSARRRMADAMAGGIGDSGVPHVVFLSAIAASLPDGNGPAKDLHYCEQQLRARAPQVTLLRSCYFQDNVAGALQTAASAGVYPNFFASADAPIPMVATRDVGRFAAQCLVAPRPAHEVVDVFGPAYSIREVVRELGAALGRELEILDIPPERHRDTLVQAGVPAPVAEAIAEMFAAFNGGLITARGDRQLIGTTPIAEVIRHYTSAAARATA